jgi:pyruvate dehydrogenase (quinone)
VDPPFSGSEVTFSRNRGRPPHITVPQAKKFSLSVAKGDSRTGEMVAGAARQLLSAVLPGR